MSESAVPSGSPDEPVMILVFRRCPVCGYVTQIQLDEEGFRRHRAGEHVQNIWPEMTPMQRETFISGVCSDACWGRLWA
jgi:hypothetical protein